MGSQANTAIMVLESCYKKHSLTGQRLARQLAGDAGMLGATNALMRYCCNHVSLLFRTLILFLENKIGVPFEKNSPAHGLQNRYSATRSTHSYEGSACTSPQRMILSTDNAPGDPPPAVVNCRYNRCLFFHSHTTQTFSSESDALWITRLLICGLVLGWMHAFIHSIIHSFVPFIPWFVHSSIRHVFCL